MDKIDLIYDHYKETVSLCKNAQKSRNKNFIILCILETISFLILVNCKIALEIIEKNVDKEFNMILPENNIIIETLLWIAVAYVTIRYVQEVIYIEKTYLYIKRIEKKLSSEVCKKFFDREGDDYQNDYPIVLNIIDLFYKMFIPVVFISINFARIIKEWREKNGSYLAVICDTTIFLFVIIVTLCYLLEINGRITKFLKNHFEILNLIAIKLRKLLKNI
ncbi:hypothetical protein KQI69_00150 [Eubacterium sp. MSJ-13]|uniref:hypothetical protein n=1 Tax=Eubacterium sp. MSJ-13 TaxID=2841513 RepID=UPI001C125038|nr:hypothetical protein [Eubacterium sp. MSJ-13]MBU5477615.1 hypothetical protein [Eubacterium sp. MSJ-13]